MNTVEGITDPDKWRPLGRLESEENWQRVLAKLDSTPPESGDTQPQERDED